MENGEWGVVGCVTAQHNAPRVVGFVTAQHNAPKVVECVTAKHNAPYAEISAVKKSMNCLALLPQRPLWRVAH